MEIIDLRISYQKGEPIAYVRPKTTHCQLVVNPKQVLPCTIIAVEPQALRDLETRERTVRSIALLPFFGRSQCAGIVYGTGKDESRFIQKEEEPGNVPNDGPAFPIYPMRPASRAIRCWRSFCIRHILLSSGS